MKRILIVGILILSGCGSSSDSAQVPGIAAPSIPSQIQVEASPSPTPSQSSKELLSSWADPVNGNVLDLVIEQGGISTTVIGNYSDGNVNAEFTGTVWQSIQIGTANVGSFILGTPEDEEFQCPSQYPNCNALEAFPTNTIWAAGTYSYSLANNILHVCNSNGLCWDLE